MTTDWVAWHRPYDNPESSLAQRLLVVQACIEDAFDHAPAGPIRVLSLCAGQSRDLAGVLANHPRRGDITGRAVDADPGNTAVGAELLAGSGVTAVTGDASTTAACAAAVPADVLLACGIFGNIVDADIDAMIHLLPTMCAEGATVIWTRHRNPPDLTPTIRSWFTDAGFDEVSFASHQDARFGVGAHRLVAPPEPFRDDIRLFTFVGDGQGALT